MLIEIKYVYEFMFRYTFLHNFQSTDHHLEKNPKLLKLSAKSSATTSKEYICKIHTKNT